MTAASDKTHYYSSYVPSFMSPDGPYGDYIKVVIRVYGHVQNFILHNLNWLRESSGQKTLLIKIPEAIISISERIGPATHIPGKMLNSVAKFLMPLHRLGREASPLIGFAEVGYKFPAMFAPSAREVSYVAEAGGQTYQASFSLTSWEQRVDRASSVVSWTLSFTGCVGYLWKLNHTADEKFPLAGIATWAGRYMSLEGLYSEGRFLYETLWIGPQLPLSEDQRSKMGAKLATVELIGSLFRLSLAIVCLSVDIFKALAAKEQSPWVETALFCASVAPAFITPLATRYWPKMVTEPLFNRSIRKLEFGLKSI